eukprot:TRINITY_DN18878_c0_g2_i1.p1 TRINITY_DN18878_c0_g2~~TRINITY_DN18878_c0_g2_i1.p1  ORF type:complete len:1971 (+),score=364.36 TRINITY_DN18878_c0_g2_i1:776-5914(+)
MEADKVKVQSVAPSFTQRRLDGQATKRFYRGVLMQVLLDHASESEGLLHWVPTFSGSSGEGSDGGLVTAGDCAGAARAPPEARIVVNANTSFFRFGGPVGTYTMCYLGRQVESTTMAEFNPIGTFEVTDVITDIRQDPALPSTRNTLRIEVEARSPGTVSCLVRAAPSDTRPEDFEEVSAAFQGRGLLEVGLAPPGTDLEFPRQYQMDIPLVYYQKTVGPLHVWCHHGKADSLVFPADFQGAVIRLQQEEPAVFATPKFLWTGSRFKLSIVNTPAIATKRVATHSPPLTDDWRLVTALDASQAEIIQYVNDGSGEIIDEHPAYQAWKRGGVSSPCESANKSTALDVSVKGFTETDGWFSAHAARPFVCFWPTHSSFPHLAGVLEIVSQAPEFSLDVRGQLRPFVYRGVGFNLRMRFTSPSGGRVLIVRKATFDQNGGACQVMHSTTRRLGRVQSAVDVAPSEDRLAMQPVHSPPLQELQQTLGPNQSQQQEEQQQQQQQPVTENARRLQGDVSTQCTNNPRRTSELILIPAMNLFPPDSRSVEAVDGLNCSRDYKLYHSPLLPNTSVLADANHNRYFLVTSNVSILLYFVPRVRLLSPSGALPNVSTVVVLQDFTSLANITSESWILTTQDCSSQELFAPASPFYEEGAEDLPLSQYMQASLPLTDFDFAGLAFLMPPPEPKVNSKRDVCLTLQPPAPPPKRPETPLDIDNPDFGRSVGSDGVVAVPALVNGSGSFLHRDDLGTYVMCYVGDETEESPIYNPVGFPFESRDVLPVDRFSVPLEPNSDSVRSYLNVTSMLRGVVRCIALLRGNAEPPTDPDEVFHPDVTARDFLGASDPTQFDVPESSKLIALELDQARARFVAPSESFAQARPTMYAWCAHEDSTLLYPKTPEGFKIHIQARPPPPFFYTQLNTTVGLLSLTLQLEFTPLYVTFSDPLFPANQYDEVRFMARPMLPNGLVIDPKTGVISGRPEMAGNVSRIIVAASINPPYNYNTVEMKIDVQDALGHRVRSVNIDHVVFTARPRSTDLFDASEVFLLIKAKTSLFSNQPQEFFCLETPKTWDGTDLQAAADLPTSIECQSQKTACCCASRLPSRMPVRDFRISTKACDLTALQKYHVAGMVKGRLKTKIGEQTTGLRSSRTADVNIPAELEADQKSPVSFNLVFAMTAEEWESDSDGRAKQLAEELSLAVAIPADLVNVGSPVPFEPAIGGGVAADGNVASGGTPTQGGSNGVVVSNTSGANPSGGGDGRRLTVFSSVSVAFGVEPRCLEQRSDQVVFFAGAMELKAGCNHVAPEEYMQELRVQLADQESALIHRKDLPLLQRVNAKYSFSSARVMHFCNRQPLWRYGAVVDSPTDCPYDFMKVGAIGIVVGTVAVFIVLSILFYLTNECASVSFLYTVRLLDLLTPVLGLYTSAADYVWVAVLRQADETTGTVAYPIFDTIFLGSLCHLFICFCVNALALRITITTYIQDTPWWRRNRSRLRFTLCLSVVSPRFFRVTLSNIAGIDATHIHFGTPSKMAMVLSNLGLVCLLQDMPQLILHSYVWLVWRNQGPKISLVCLALGLQSVLVATLHHIFSRSQRAAYERVVKLLGVRRLTAGFFDVSAAAGGGTGSSGLSGNMNVLENVRRADTDGAGVQDGNDSSQPRQALGDVIDPAKLNPIQAAMYVAQIYEKESRAKLHQSKQQSVGRTSTTADEEESEEEQAEQDEKSE